MTIFHSRGWYLSRLLALPRWQVLAAFHVVVLLLLALAGGLYAEPPDSDPLDEISEKSIDDVLRSDEWIVVEWPEGLETREPPRPQDFPFPTLGCQTLITQADLDANLPYVIATPGTYCFVEDIDVTFPQSAVPSAIVIRASDVFLWLRGYRLRGLPSTWPPDGDGIRIEGGQSNILIDGGSMAGCNTGIWGDGLSVPLHQVTIRDMRFEEFLGVCVYLQGSTESSVAANTFTGCAIGLAVDGGMTKTEVVGNAFALNSSTFGWFQMGIYGSPSGLRIADNKLNGPIGRGRALLAAAGSAGFRLIKLLSGTRRDWMIDCVGVQSWHLEGVGCTHKAGGERHGKGLYHLHRHGRTGAVAEP